MIGKKPLFAELNGFIIYEPKLLKEYLIKNDLKDKNVLNYFIETNHGDIITESGIAIPMTDIEDGYYNFSLVKNENDSIIKSDTKIINSKGWVLNITSGEIYIIGIGYFVDINTIPERYVPLCLKIT
jgi:hypothetical protein